ncbi:MAG: ABC transporter substrate-binding protein [Candidatus Omnitrophota bacterium]
MKVVRVICSALIILSFVLPQCMGQEVFKFGMPLPLTGAKKKFGESIKNGAMVAIEEFNAKGGFKKGVLKGRNMEVVIEDTAGLDDKIKEVVTKFITVDKYPFLFGVYGSSSSLIAGEIAAQHGTPYLLGWGASDKIGQKGWKNTFRMVQSSSQYLGGLNDFLLRVVKPKTVAILYESTAYGKSTADCMRRFCVEKGIPIVFDQAYEAKQTDYQPMLLEVKRANPEAIFMVSYLMDAILLMKQSKELNINPKVFTAGAAGFVMPDFPAQAGDAAEYVITSSLWAPGVKYKGAKEFSAKYQQMYGDEPPYHAAIAYAGISVLVDVLERTESLQAQDIIDALSATDLMTAYGRITFEDYGGFTNQITLPTIAMQIQKGKFVTIWPEEGAEGPYWYPVPKWSER